MVAIVDHGSRRAWVVSPACSPDQPGQRQLWRCAAAVAADIGSASSQVGTRPAQFLITVEPALSGWTRDRVNTDTPDSESITPSLGRLTIGHRFGNITRQHELLSCWTPLRPARAGCGHPVRPFPISQGLEIESATLPTKEEMNTLAPKLQRGLDPR